MSDKNPNPGRTGETPAGKPKALLCEQWEALLVDALDGTLGASESAAFYAHRDTCLACAQLLEESKRGSEWLHFLDTEPEVPADLIGRILAKTSGAVDTLPAAVPAGMPLAVPVPAGWTGGWLPMMERHAVQSRWMMTAATAFFSIAFMLNQTGIKLNGFRLADLRPTTLASGLTRQFYVANKSVMRYYDNLRFVYELESRVREMRRDTQPETPAAGSKSTPGSTPAGTPNGDDQKTPAKHTGGSARAPEPEPEAEPLRHAEPVLADFQLSPRTGFQDIHLYIAAITPTTRLADDGATDGSGKNDSTTNSSKTNSGGTNGGRKMTNDKRSEGSLA